MSKVTYDRRSILIDDRRFLILSGTMHYPRSTPYMWSYLMRLAMEAHLNTVSTYIFWNLHERQKGKYDFSGRLNLEKWLEIAHGLDLKVILRLGPYICAETNYGGFPVWLRDISDIRFRINNDIFMEEVEKWLRYLADKIRPYTAANGGPVILVQLENEYNMVASNYPEEDTEQYLKWHDKLYKSLDLGVPLIMCEGSSPGAIETLNGFIVHNKIPGFRNKHRNIPILWTENWTGWYKVWGSPNYLRSAENIAWSVARFIAEGGAGVNYYPFHGGANFARECMYLQTQSYDFHAPVDETGFPTAKYCHLAKLNFYLSEYSEVILNAVPAVEELGSHQKAVMLRNDDRFINFDCNDDDSEVRVAREAQTQILKGKSVIITSDQGPLMDTSIPAFSCLNWIKTKVAPLESPVFLRKQEPFPEEIEKSGAWIMQIDTPEEMLQFTKDETDYCWYSAVLSIPEGEPETGVLSIEGVADVVHLFLDQEFIASTKPPLDENRGPLDGISFHQEFHLEISPGKHRLDILCCSLGLIKGDWMIQNTNMVSELKGIWRGVAWNGKEVSGPWKIIPGLAGERQQFYDDAKDLSRWSQIIERGIGRPLTWWKMFFDRPKFDDPLLLDLAGMNKGLIWINGELLGRYWLVNAVSENMDLQETPVTSPLEQDLTQRYYSIPFQWIKDRNNCVVIFEETGGDPSSLNICRKGIARPECVDKYYGRKKI